VRSGEVVARGFADYPALWAQGAGKLAFTTRSGVAPQPSPAPSEAYTLLVRAFPLDSGGPEIAWRVPSAGATPDGGGAFFPAFVQLPAPGRWLLVAQHAADRGCFVYTLPASGAN